MSKVTSRSLLLITLIVVSTLFLAGCNKEEVTTEDESGTSTEESAENTEESTEVSSDGTYDYDGCVTGCEFLWKANEANGGKSADEMNFDCRNLCISGQGMELDDPSACAQATGTLRDTCYTDVASDTNDPSLCALIEEGLFKSTCYYNIAQETGDTSICENITDSMYKSICLDIE